MADDKPKRGRPRKQRQQLSPVPAMFEADDEQGLT